MINSEKVEVLKLTKTKRRWNLFLCIFIQQILQFSVLKRIKFSRDCDEYRCLLTQITFDGNIFGIYFLLKDFRSQYFDPDFEQKSHVSFDWFASWTNSLWQLHQSSLCWGRKIIRAFLRHYFTSTTQSISWYCLWFPLTFFKLVVKKIKKREKNLQRNHLNVVLKENKKMDKGEKFCKNDIDFFSFIYFKEKKFVHHKSRKNNLLLDSYDRFCS